MPAQALHWWLHSDALTQGAALLLLAMSVASWVVILYKTRLLRRAQHDITHSMAAFWQAHSLAQALQRLPHFDREAFVVPLITAAHAVRTAPNPDASNALAAQGPLAQQLTRALRDALHTVLARLQWGQVLLATVGSTAPFVGLLGTVWGIYHALSALAAQSSAAGTISIDRLAAPVGEALIMTAAGLAVAIPAVLAYNWQGRSVAHLEAQLEGFAWDVRELLLAPS